MRLNSKLKAACLAGVAVVATLAAGEALAGGRGGGGGGGRGRGGWGGGGHAIGRAAAGGHSGDWVGVGHRAIGSPFASGYALNRAYHGRYGDYGGYGGSDYWGGYYGGGGVYYGDADYGYGYGGYGDDYAGGVPAAYSALTYPSSYQRIYQVPTTVCQRAAHTSYVPVTTLSGQPAHHLSPGAITRDARASRLRNTSLRTQKPSVAHDRGLFNYVWA
jgi:hypothetical protein